MAAETDKQIAGILGKLNDALDAFSAAATEHGDLAVETALSVARVTAASTLADGAVGIALFCIAAALFWKFAAPWAKQSWDMHHGGEKMMLGGICYGAAALVFGVSGLVLALKIFSVWAWVGLFEPKLYIAKQILNKVL